MPSKKSPRKGSLQYWPRKRAAKFLPRVNWNAINSDTKGLKGFICYKAGMFSAYLKDNTPNSLTKGKKVTIPTTLIECPPMKIFSARFYKDKIVVKEILAENPEKELKRKIKIPKKKGGNLDEMKKEEFDDVSVLCYSVIKKTGIKKTPDMSEIGLGGNIDEKINFIKENLGKEMHFTDFFRKGGLIDVRGLTKGKGLQGPVKRFGIRLKQHKSEKGVRRPGSLGPWHPARVTFRVPMAGQLGMFTRVSYNHNIIENGNSEKNPQKFLKNIKNFGEIKTEFSILNGSIQGPAKRQMIITYPLRKSKKQEKKSYEFIELR